MALWKRIRRVWSDDYQSWQSIDNTPIPLSIGRIWSADKTGKYHHWMKRADRSKPPPDAPGQNG